MKMQLKNFEFTKISTIGAGVSGKHDQTLTFETDGNLYAARQVLQVRENGDESFIMSFAL